MQAWSWQPAPVRELELYNIQVLHSLSWCRLKFIFLTYSYHGLRIHWIGPLNLLIRMNNFVNICKASCPIKDTQDPLKGISGLQCQTLKQKYHSLLRCAAKKARLRDYPWQMWTCHFNGLAKLSKTAHYWTHLSKGAQTEECCRNTRCLFLKWSLQQTHIKTF